MAAHSTSRTITTEDPCEDPYASQSRSTPWKEEVLAQPGNTWPPHLLATQTKRSRYYDRFADFYSAVSWTCGFREKYSLALSLFFGGTLIGFCLSRTIMMAPANVRTKTAPGEWFWYRQPLYKSCMLIHIYLSIISGVFAVFQFIPGIRRRSVILHRINGYLVLALLIPSTVCGGIVARHSYGGELNVQSAWYTISFLIVFSSIFGIMNVKHTRKHRKWMLRTVAYAAIPVTARFAVMSAKRIISDLGTYYATWRCDEMLFVVKSMDTLTRLYPQCVGADNLDTLHAAVRAGLGDGPLGRASTARVTRGMALWIATIIHIIGVEFYIRISENANQFRRGFVLERNDIDDDTERRPDDK